MCSDGKLDLPSDSMGCLDNIPHCKPNKYDTYKSSEGCCLRNHLIEIRSPVLQAISQLILEIGPTAAKGGGEENFEVISGKTYGPNCALIRETITMHGLNPWNSHE